MSRVAINTGSTANDGTGDSLRIAGGKINTNFAELYNFLGDGTDLTPTWRKTSSGINTTSNVGIGTTNPRFTLEVGSVGSSGTSLFVNGDARVTGILTVGSSSIIINGNQNKILVGSGVSIDGNTGIISATAFYAGGVIVSGGGGGGSGINYWGTSASGISTTSNVAIGTVTPTSKLTVSGNSLFTGIATFRSNLTIANLNSLSNTLRFGSNSYIDQSNTDVFTFQIDSGTNDSSTDSSFVFRATKPGSPNQQYDALRVYSGGNHWNRLVRVYTNIHVDNNAFVAGDLQVGAASTLIGAGNTLGTFKVGTGGTVITTTSTGLVGIGTTNPTSASRLTVNGGISLSGVITATSGIVTYYGDISNAVDGRWILGADGTSNYTFTGIGFTQTTNDPVLYLTRGRVYEFVNNSGGSHPFQIRVGNGAVSYNDGVTNNGASSGTIRFQVPLNAPNTLYYQCTNHAGMGATIFVTPRNEPAVGSRSTITATTGSVGAGSTVNLNINGFKTYSLLKVGITSAAWVVLYTDATSRTNDETRSYLTDPEPGSGVIAEVRSTSTGGSTFIMSPGVIGWNNDVSVGSTIYARVTNNESSSSSGIGITLTVVKLED